MLPSSFSISQITPAGLRPARRARSTAPSVCPALTSTPPLRADSGNIWPGFLRSSGPVFSSMRTSTVRARSWAEIPVVVPSRASTETVNAVPNLSWLFSTMRSRPSRWARSLESGAQMRPRPCVAIKLTASGVQCSAAMIRSPSFSRSSLSTRMIILPFRISSIISWMSFAFMACSPAPVDAEKREKTGPVDVEH